MAVTKSASADALPLGPLPDTRYPDVRIESRAIFVVDENNTIRHVEYVKAVGDHPDYEAALKAAKASS